MTLPSAFIPPAKVASTLKRQVAAHPLSVIEPRDKVGQHVLWSLRESNLGTVLVAVCEERICWMGFADRGKTHLLSRFYEDWGMAQCQEGDHPLMAKAVALTPSEVPLLISGTPFQIAVWAALVKIPRGQLIRYGDLAVAIGRPNAARAVGNAVGANPISWLIPCHRVGHSSGSLKGFGWGEPCKRRLLTLEGAL